MRDADEIIVMKSGEVKERGKHDELIALNGFYKKLVARQLVSGDQAVNFSGALRDSNTTELEM